MRTKIKTRTKYKGEIRIQMSALEMINSVSEISDDFFEYQLASRMARRLGEEMMDSGRPTRTYIYY